MPPRKLAGGKRQRAWGPGPPPRGGGHSGEREASRNGSDLNSEGSLQAGTVSAPPFFLSSSLCSFPPGRRENWEVELALKARSQSPGGRSTLSQTHQREPESGEGRSQTSLLDLYFNFRKELRKHALESQEGDKSCPLLLWKKEKQPLLFGRKLLRFMKRHPGS